MIKKYLIIILLGIIIFYGVLWSSYSFARLGIRGNISILRFGTNMYNGSATSGATDYAYYTQALGGVDDYNDAQTAYPTGSYQGSWTDCVVGNNYCGTGDATYADAKDNQTGLVWSIPLDVAGDYTQTWFWANNCYYSGTSTDCDIDGEAGCRCTKLTEGSKTGCEALPGGGWRLPYQKELMQAYINGSSKSSVSYLSSTTGSYWSAVTYSTNTCLGWYVYLSNGGTGGNNKTNDTGYRIRCVR